jgi:hypothetical protein
MTKADVQLKDDKIEICVCNHSRDRHLNRGIRNFNVRAAFCKDCHCGTFILYRTEGVYNSE